MERLLQLKRAILNFGSINDIAWCAFATKLAVKSFLKGDFLINEGQIENYLYFINTGATRSYFLQNDKELTVDFQFAGEFVTSYYSFITREPSEISIEALSPTEVVAIPHKFLHQFYNSSHDAEKIGRLVAESQYIRRLRKEIDMLSFTAEERYQRLMQRNPFLIQSLSVKHLSSYLGIHPESLSRIRRQYGRN